MLQQQAAVTQSLRTANPDVNIPHSVLGNVPLGQSDSHPGLKATYDQEFAFDNLLVNSEAYRRSMGIPPSRIAREAQATSTPDETDGSGIDEKGATAVNASSSNTWPQDDEPPEYTPYPTEPVSQPPRANYGYVPQTRAVFGFPSAPAPTSTPSDLSPPTSVPPPTEYGTRALEANPDKIRYRKPLDKETFFPVTLRNPNTSTVRFRVRTSAPKKYCVRPNRGEIEAGGEITVQFVLVPRNDPLPNDVCMDKFLIECIVLKKGESFDWAKDGWRRTNELANLKMRVEFLAPE